MQELYKKDLNEPDNHDGVVSHPEPDLLEYEVKWALGSTDDAIKVLHSICQQIWKTQQWPQDWKRSTRIPVPKKGSIEECANHWTFTHFPTGVSLMKTGSRVSSAGPSA